MPPPLAVVAVDLDRFKPVNDRYRHAVGDELPVKIADMLGLMAEEDTVSSASHRSYAICAALASNSGESADAPD